MPSIEECAAVAEADVGTDPGPAQSRRDLRVTRGPKRTGHEEEIMDVLIDWQDMAWDEPDGEPQKGFRSKTQVLEGQQVLLAEFSEGFVEDGWCTEGHLFHVLSGQSTLRMKDGNRGIHLRPGVTGILPDGELAAHRMEPVAGERIEILLFEQP
jgi:hypothetical protein